MPNIERKFPISLGDNRYSMKWRNTSITWESLKNKLRTPMRDHITMAQYNKLSKAKKQNKKDVGGFVAGIISNNRRINSNIVSRSILTLDLDYAEPDFWDDVSFVFEDTAVCVYSTRSHSPQNPRYRMLIPLNRDVTPDEYVAIARRAAEWIGIEQMDDTTYQPARLMFWPSVNEDGEYVFLEQDGGWLSADDVLATYPGKDGWKDVTLWPTSSREDKAWSPSEVKKLEDPREKDGLIGAFCRTYTIQEAIEKFIPDVYTRAKDDRYTYTAGSSAQGLVIYGDVLAYSNHATDPAAGHAQNAFDLVRIHKFGQLDTKDPEEYGKTSAMPSFKAMSELAGEDADVSQDLVKAEFAVPLADLEEDSEEDLSWLSELPKTKDGKGFEPRVESFLTLFEHIPALKDFCRYNDFSHVYECRGPMPWNKNKEYGSLWTDQDSAGLRWYMSAVWKITNKMNCQDALDVYVMRHKYHPIRDYLNNLSWDGTPRVDTFFIDYLGANDTEYARTATRKTLVAAVARVMQPGCKFDNVLTLTGPQGIGKSTALAKLGVSWFSDSLRTVQGKEAYEAVQGSWIIEFGELTALRKAEVEEVKKFISKCTDKFRPAYGKFNVEFPRQCVFIGTTNEIEFLRDSTGNRRYWPLEVGKNKPEKDVFRDLTQAEVDQIWAEALLDYQKGEELFMPRELLDDALSHQHEHEEDDPRKGMIERFLDTPVPPTWDQMNIAERRTYINGDAFGTAERTGTLRQKVCAAEIIIELFGKDRGSFTKADTRLINSILDGLPGWERMPGVARFPEYGVQRGFRRIVEADENVTENDDF